MKNKKKQYRIIAWSVVFLVFVITLARSVYSLIVDQESWSMREIASYRQLFTHDALAKLKLFNTIESKVREPESQYIYKNDFNVLITKTRIPASLKLSKAIRISKNHSQRESSQLYFAIRSFGGEILLKSEKVSLVNNIEINAECPDIKVVSIGEDQITYYFEYKTFSIVFNKDQDYIDGKAAESNIPASISFRKRNDLLYIIMMTPANANAKMQKSQLVDILE
ncbi:hypothetical protein [Mucilaginibacter sp. BT774]|uniref:hypothetical protein n=1 Tax=Mucilaginibacter sp. BT774 TaxID=3062276 RepID=UPI002676B306|nr:hypothetical protein [Mucilaginibacter sp. BT774]MDO3624897.1 hypothetical protein [Mucilaginibacter sp. BT774]